jgi:hypothetical protein
MTAAITTEQRGALKAQLFFLDSEDKYFRAEVPSRRAENEHENDTEQETTVQTSTVSHAAHHYFIGVATEVLIGMVFVIPPYPAFFSAPLVAALRNEEGVNDAGQVVLVGTVDHDSLGGRGRHTTNGGRTMNLNALRGTGITVR